MHSKVFVDTSVLFSAVLSPGGGSRLILELGEAGAVQLLVSRQVLKEADGVLKRKARDMLPLFSILLEQTGCVVTRSASGKERYKWEKVVGHKGNAQIVADAVGAGCDYLVTLDKVHLLGINALFKRLPCKLGSPGDFLSWFREMMLE